MTLDLTTHATRDILAAELAGALAAACRSAHDDGRIAGLALAGGSTPLPAYRLLGGMNLDWQRVVAVPTDERWVPAGHSNRNQDLIQASLDRPEQPVRALCPADAAGEPGIDAANAALSDLSDPFDVTVVGMGADGHFASLFPGSFDPGIALDPASTQDAVVVRPHSLPDNAPHDRISLTLARLLRSRRLILVLTGQDKLDVLERAAAGHDDPRVLPVAALLAAAESTLDIHWSL